MTINSTNLLGPFPWSEETVRKAYFQDFQKTRRAIKRHPGFAYYEALKTIQISCEIFLDSTEDLLGAIELFKQESDSEGFWMRAMRERFKKIEVSIRRGIFSTSASAMALVAISRNINNKVMVQGYQSQIDKYFSSNEEHRFIQDLRNYACHYNVIESNWQVSQSRNGDKVVEFLLYAEHLLTWGKWSKQAKKFIEKSPEGINVENLFRSYKDQVSEFQVWFRRGLVDASGSLLSEYNKYENMLNHFDSESLWKVIFSQIAPGKINPYEYLDLYLTKKELDEVFLLPKNSQRQVDRIIEMIDEFGVCDESLRKKIYSVFNINI